MKNKLMLFVYLLGSLISSIGYIQAQCNTCDIEITTGSGECDREIASKGSENKLELVPNETLCITGDLEYSDISWADGATLRVTPGNTLTIQNNMDNNTNDISLTIELYGTLIMGNPQFNPNLTLNIYSGGKFQTSGNTAFKGNDVTINNEGIFDVMVLDLNGDNSKVLIQNDPKAEFLIKQNLNVGNTSTLFFQNEGTLDIQAQFGLSPTSVYSNCGYITTKGFNLQKGKVFNTGVMVIDENLDGEGTIENYGQITLSKIQGGGKTFINHGKVEVTSNNVVDMTIKGPEDPGFYGEFSWKGKVDGLNNLYVYGNQIFKNTDPSGESSESGMLPKSEVLKPQSGSEIKWGECEECTVIFTGKGCFDPETGEQDPGPNPDPTNYWIGGTTDKMNDWAEPKNWTAERVPDEMEDIEFATEANNPTDASKPSSGPAKEDLHLDIDRNIGDLINKSDKNLIVTLENELVIHGKVHDDNTGGIVVQADPEKPAGTLIFKDPGINNDVDATVQFYNKAYECADCGFYRKQWQYFGVPVKSATFPYSDVDGDETINMYVEPHNGDKWRPVSSALEAFKGYQINNSLNEAPQDVYNFDGILNVGDANVALTKTENVNYSGTNLVSNSYTAAIPIIVDAMTFPVGVEETVYLFNTGTRDQWRKLNGTNIPGYKSGQYLAVPMNLGGQGDFPDKIPSTHAFMVLKSTAGDDNLIIDYSKLIKNTTVNKGDGTQITTRAMGSSNESKTSSVQQLPSLVIDVIGEESADRVWIFQKEGTSHNFNNGWDGRKMLEDDIAQLYVSALDESKLQVATVPELDSLSLGFIADIDGKYTFEFAQMGKLKEADIYLHDAVTGTTHQVGHGQSYSFTAKKGEATNRFSFSSKDNSAFLSSDESLLDVTASSDGKIKIVNSSSRTVSAFVYNIVGGFVKRVEVKANSETVLSDIAKGEHIVRLQNSNLNDVRRVTVE